ncbi:MAG: tRNA-guanine transglycosylase, partial [Gammaproteobacteria bacterium]
MARFNTEIIAKSSHNHARVTKVTTAHGSFETPAFMPVATRAFVNHMSPRDLIESGSQIILGGNTYHMLVNPGMDIIRAAGGMHKFMNWSGPMLTDSGGFQVFSLSQ